MIPLIQNCLTTGFQAMILGAVMNFQQKVNGVGTENQQGIFKNLLDPNRVVATICANQIEKRLIPGTAQVAVDTAKGFGTGIKNAIGYKKHEIKSFPIEAEIDPDDGPNLGPVTIVKNENIKTTKWKDALSYALKYTIGLVVTSSINIIILKKLNTKLPQIQVNDQITTTESGMIIGKELIATIPTFIGIITITTAAFFIYKKIEEGNKERQKKDELILRNLQKMNYKLYNSSEEK